MHRHWTLSLPLLALLALAGTRPAAAAERGFYAGGAYGLTELRDACTGLELDGFGSCDDSDDGFKVFGGYQFNRNWGVELAYADLGAARVELAEDDFVVTGDLGVDGFGAAGTGTIPLGEWFALFGKAGLFHWQADTDVRADFLSFSDSASGESLVYGAGVLVDLGERAGLRAEWERYTDVGDQDTTGETDIDMISAGVLFRF